MQFPESNSIKEIPLVSAEIEQNGLQKEKKHRRSFTIADTAEQKRIAANNFLSTISRWHCDILRSDFVETIAVR